MWPLIEDTSTGCQQVRCDCVPTGSLLNSSRSAAKADDEMIHIEQRTSELPRLARWPNAREKGMLLEPLFPHFAHDALTKLDVPFTTRIVELFKPFVSDVKILDLYKEGQSVRSTFLCDVIKSTLSCALSLKDNATDTLEDFLGTSEENEWYNFQVCEALQTSRALIRPLCCFSSLTS